MSGEDNRPTKKPKTSSSSSDEGTVKSTQNKGCENDHQSDDDNHKKEEAVRSAHQGGHQDYDDDDDQGCQDDFKSFKQEVSLQLKIKMSEDDKRPAKKLKACSSFSDEAIVSPTQNGDQGNQVMHQEEADEEHVGGNQDDDHQEAVDQGHQDYFKEIVNADHHTEQDVLDSLILKSMFRYMNTYKISAPQPYSGPLHFFVCNVSKIHITRQELAARLFFLRQKFFRFPGKVRLNDFRDPYHKDIYIFSNIIWGDRP